MNWYERASMSPLEKTASSEGLPEIHENDLHKFLRYMGFFPTKTGGRPKHWKWINDRGEHVSIKWNSECPRPVLALYLRQMGSNAREFIEWYRTGRVKSREDVLHQHKEENKPKQKAPEYYKPTEQEKQTIIDFAKIDEPASSIAKLMLLPLDVVQKVIDEVFPQAKVAESGRQLRRS